MAEIPGRSIMKQNSPRGQYLVHHWDYDPQCHFNLGKVGEGTIVRTRKAFRRTFMDYIKNRHILTIARANDLKKDNTALNFGVSIRQDEDNKDVVVAIARPS